MFFGVNVQRGLRRNSMIIISIFLCLLSLVYLWFLGLPNILPTLGWSTLLLPIAWISLYVCTKLKAYSRSILIFALLLFGCVFLNQIGALIFNGVISTASIWLFMLQGFLIWVPFISMVTTVTKKPERFRLREAVDYFSLWLAYLPMWSVLIFSPLWNNQLSPSRLLILLYAPTLLYAFLIFVMFLRMTRQEFEYLMSAPIRAPNHAKRFKRITILFLVLGLASIGLEYFRGMWMFALLGCFSLILLSAAICTLYRHIFLPMPLQINKPSVFHFPLSYIALFLTMLSIPAWAFVYMALKAKYG